MAHNYLDLSEWVAEESDIDITVQDCKVGRQSLEYHVSADVHLTLELLLSVRTGSACARIIGVVETRYRHVAQHLARLATDSDEQKVVDVMRSKTGLVEVEGHVRERFVYHRQYDVAV